VEKMGSSQSALNFGAGPAKLPREVIMPIKKKIVGGIAVTGYN
jgi:phosphoserine aminotransferase